MIPALVKWAGYAAYRTIERLQAFLAPGPTSPPGTRTYGTGQSFPPPGPDGGCGWW